MTLDLVKYSVEIGRFLRKIRKEQNKTIGQLCYRDGLTLISRNALADIENGKVVPKLETLQLILHELGYTLADLEEAIYGELKAQFENTTATIGELLRQAAFEQAQTVYHQLRNSNCYDSDDPIVKQQFVFYDAVLLHRLAVNLTQAIRVMKQGLVARRPSMFKLHKKERQLDIIDHSYIEQTVLGQWDYRMLSSLAIMFSKDERLDEAITLQRSIIASLNLPIIRTELRNRLLSALYSNHATLLNQKQVHDEALETCHLGMDLHRKMTSTRFLAKLYGNAGLAYGHLGDKEKALQMYKLSIKQSIHDGKPEEAETTREGALSAHNLKLDYEVDRIHPYHSVTG